MRRTKEENESAFITDEGNKEASKQLEQQTSSELPQLAAELRKTSTFCVAIMEKYRALKLLNVVLKKNLEDFKSLLIQKYYGLARVHSQ